jgi:uncharacterized YigZ family protein
LKTLASAASIEVEIKRSRFVAQAARIGSEAGAMQFLESVGAPPATHKCWGWQVGQQYRFSDDGEPASTAGKPILAAIEGKGLDHAMVVVTRYFGGTKLGAGGLVRAYGGSAAKCIDRAGIVRIEPRARCVVEADFRWTGPVYAALEQAGAVKRGESYFGGGVRIELDLPEKALPGLRATLRDATRGEARVRRSGST